MSIDALETLRTIELLDKNDRSVNLSKIDSKEIQRKLTEYERLRTLELESVPKSLDFAALVSSVSASNAVFSLLPSCFLYNRVYTNDPLMKIARTPDHMTSVQMQSLGMDPKRDVSIVSLANKLEFFEMLAPLIRLGCISVLPLDKLHRRSEGSVPIYYSEDWFQSEVPEHLHDYVHENAIIREMRPGSNGKGMEVLDHSPKSPTRGIAVQFANDTSVTGLSFYNLYEQEIIEKIDDTHLKIAQKLDWDNPPNEEYFKAWVYQSINKTIIERIKSISKEMVVANELNASYLTESEFEAQLCGMSSQTTSSENQRVDAVNFLNANAPYLKLDNPAVLARFRSNNAKLFERWQQTLLYASQELSGLQDNFDDRSRQLFEHEIRPQVEEMNRALIKLSAGLGGAALLSAGAIGFALLSGPALPLASVLGLGGVMLAGDSMSSVSDYLSSHKGPAYIWKKLIKE